MKKNNETYESVCFPILAYEIDEQDAKESKLKIKRKLKYYGLQEYNEDRVSELRKLKDELKTEFQKGSNSVFFSGTHGEFADPNDFYLEKIVEHYHLKYPNISISQFFGIVNFAVYIFYLR
jgi:hypothetical protein